jgi:hypothetical protein
MAWTSRRMLSQRGNGFSAQLANEKMFKSRICRIKFDFQKSLTTGPWDHKDSVSEKKFKNYHACVPLRKVKVR